MTALPLRRDLAFVLHDWLDVSELCGRARFLDHDLETFDAVLGLAERLAHDRLAPHYRRNDTEEPAFDGTTVHVHEGVRDGLAALANAGFIGAPLDEGMGGGQLPVTVATACQLWFDSANVSTSSYAGLTRANAGLLARLGPSDLVNAYVPAMLTGRYTGTMCISESEAGSSVGDLQTRAAPAEDGTYRITGQKMWISGGDHNLSENIIHLVLARRTGAPPGPRGVSLFCVPKLLPDGSPNDVAVSSLNHKMGWRGTTNTALNFGDGTHRPGGAAGAVGHLLGEPERGLAAMFPMMNEARISVGTSAVALGYAGYLESLEYARSRRQGRPPGQRHLGGQPIPIIEHIDVRRMLLAQKSYVEGGLAFNLYCARLVDEADTSPSAADRQRAAQMLGVLTPVAKSWPSQWCLEANHLAMQVMGGAGYTRDHTVEQRLRDNRLNMIHEGTHGIQAIDLLGRKVVADGGLGWRATIARVQQTVDTAIDRGGEPAELSAPLEDAVHALDLTATALWQREDLDATLESASLFLELFGHVLHAWVWLEMFLATGDRTDAFYEGKRQTARYFFTHELPRTHRLLALLASRDTVVTGLDPDWL
ncbi:acyl-CoA dehydrogenase [Aeromicrobium sp. CTD01-1L150]|uniref:acyl-CoA dehydrogenase n=1 Tax=Aeromicrobium sp. CTD01-1L150 TaxID=3341830 RepID=UPI0035C20DA4